MIDFVIPHKYCGKTDTNRLEEAFDVCIKYFEKEQDSTISLKLTDNKEITKLNKHHRHLNEPTDVLSFENDYIDLETGSHFLGDIVISIEKAQLQADEQEHTLQDEIEMLFIHGVLHIFGYDHTTKSEFMKMSQAQDMVLKNIGNPLLGSIYAGTED